MIREFYKNRSILLTGVPGFVGKGVLAKIMADLPEVRQIYVLTRQRRKPDGELVDAKQRLESECFGTSLFDRLKATDPVKFAESRSKVIPVTGDITQDGLGCDPDVYARMLEDVDLIIANAATVEFDAPLDFSVQLNALGPQKLLDFARSCRHCATMVQVSTAYVNGQLPGTIHEQPLPIDRTIRQMMSSSDIGEEFDPDREVEDCTIACKKIEQTASSQARREAFRSEILAQRNSRRPSAKRLEKLIDDRCKNWLKRELVREGMDRAKACGWHDVYTFTKALGEQLLVKHHGDVPLVIVRPSVIESSLKDPEPGWISGLKVSDPLIVAYGRGLVPDFPALPDAVLDLIPVDMVVNAILAAATQAGGGAAHVPVFHVASGCENPLTNIRLYELIRIHFSENPMRGRDGQIPALPEWSFPSRRKFRMVFNLRYMYPLNALQWLFKRLPVRLVPSNRKRSLVALRTRLQRVLYYIDLFSPYTHLECRFQTAATRSLYESLPAAEQVIFDMDVTQIDWPEYYARIHLPGLRRHVLKEEIEHADPLLQESPDEVGAAEVRWHDEEEIETVPDLVATACARHADRIAFQIHRDGGWSRFTYAETAACIDLRVGSWQKMKWEPGDRLILLGANEPEWVFSYVSAVTLGLTVVPVDPETNVAQLWGLIDFAEATGVIAPSDLLDKVIASRPSDFDRDLQFLDIHSGASRVAVPSADGGRRPRISAEMAATVLFTSGPVIEPRGVVLTHGNFIANLLALSEVQQVDADDRILSTLPLHHALEFTGGMLMSILAGATTTYLDTLNSRSILEAIRTTGTTAVMGVPRLFKLLADRVRRLDCAADLSTLRLVVSGGAPLTAELYGTYQEFGIALCEGYGLSEAAPVVSVNPTDKPRAGSVGQPLPGQEVRIDGEQGQREGEVFVRGDNVTQGYLKMPELTAAAIVDGWLRTGDRGYVDEDGYLYITGHSDRIILTGGGKNVYAEEVEAVYWGLPHVSELAVVGIHSARTQGEEVHGVVVLQPGGFADAAGMEIRQSVNQISRDQPTYARLQHIHFWRRPLPRDDEGEVDRAALKSELGLDLGERAEMDDSVPPLERLVYTQASRIGGLSCAEVMSHSNVPIDTLLDSLMGVEFSACLQERLGLGDLPIDRSGQSLRDLVDEIELRLNGGLEKMELEGGVRPGQFWNQLLSRSRADSPATSRSLGRRIIQSAFWTPGRTILQGFYAFEASGQEHLPQDRPYLIAANFTSHLDAPAVFMAVRPHVEMLSLAAATSYFQHSRASAWFMRTIANALPLDPSEGCQESLGRIRALIGKRRPLLVFPEGGRSPGDQIQPFKSGVGLLALEMDVPIVPLHIHGTRGRWGRPVSRPAGRGKRRGNPIRLLFGEPVEMERFRPGDGDNRYESYRLIAAQLKQEIEALSRRNGPERPARDHGPGKGNA